MPHEQHVKIGEIVFLDHVIVLEREKCGPISAFRQQQRCRLAQLPRRWLAAIGERKSLGQPLAERPPDFWHRAFSVHPLRPPRLPSPPPGALPAPAPPLL